MDGRHAAAAEWARAFSSLLAPQDAPGIRRMLERGEAAQREAAEQHRAEGRGADAGLARRAAAELRLALDHPAAARQLYAMSARLGGTTSLEVMLAKALSAAIDFTHADFGNVQLVDPGLGALRIAVQRGFSNEFLEYFAVVADESSACGRAANGAEQTVVPDVTLDPAFAPHRAIAEASRFAAVQSTPLLDASGRTVGVLSTHYATPRTLTGPECAVLSLYGERVGHQLGRCAVGAPVFEPSYRPVRV